MKFKLEIQMGNVAMMSRRDVARKLEEVVVELKEIRPPQFRMSMVGRKILDDNGNTVGEWGFLKEEDREIKDPWDEGSLVDRLSGCVEEGHREFIYPDQAASLLKLLKDKNEEIAALKKKGS